MDGFCTCFPEPRAVVFEEPAKDTVFEEQITVRSETARVAMPAAVAVAPEDNELKQSDIEDESLDLEEGHGERSASRIRSVVPLASDGTAEQALYEYWGYDIECIGACACAAGDACFFCGRSSEERYCSLERPQIPYRVYERRAVGLSCCAMPRTGL